ncbi:hypothetical protein C0J52_08765 [Blattella germanica]|nr:hypothetical protein C0J52_08765 [Blattella germanica]
MGHIRHVHLTSKNRAVPSMTAALFIFMVMLIGVSLAELQCRDEDNNPVDWYVLYKLPRTKQSSHNLIKKGLAYAYITSQNVSKGWILSEKSINDSQSMPDPLLWIQYNDQPPQGATTSQLGHTKGVLMTNESGGFWLVHSVPHFPPSPNSTMLYSYPLTGTHYGQSFLCISLNSSQIDLVEAIPVKQRRSRKSDGKEGTQYSSSFRYFIMCGSQKKVVCRKAFRSLHAVGMKRVYNISCTLLRGEIPKDTRGLAPAVNKISVVIQTSIDNHIKSFPLKSSHYAGKEIHYLDARLTVKSMYEFYCVKYPDSTVKYDYYREYFRQNYAYRFGRMQIDTCSLCEELKAKLKSPHINENAQRVARAELEVHLRRSRKFYKSLKEHSSVSQSEHTRSIAFDFMQNLPLPNIPVQETFYLRQLWVNVFNVHDLQTGRSVVYLYHEGQGKKDANEYNEPKIYDSRVPSELQKQFPNLVAAAEAERVKTAPWYHEQELFSLAGQKFFSFAKAGKFEKELYYDWIAPTLQISLLVESWLNGAGKVENISSLKLKAAGIKFKSSHDHSKWAVAEKDSDDAKDWVCVGDINRMENQETRGGGTVCINHYKLWPAYRQLIDTVDPCPRRQ